MTTERLPTERKLRPLAGIMPQEADMFSGDGQLTEEGIGIRLGVFRLAVRIGVIREDGLLITGEGISTYVDPKGEVDTAGLLQALGDRVGLDLVDRIEDLLATPDPDWIRHWAGRCRQIQEKRPQLQVMHANRPVKGMGPERGHGRYRRR